MLLGQELLVWHWHENVSRECNQCIRVHMAKNFSHGMERSHKIPPFKSKYTQVIIKSILERDTLEKLRNNHKGFLRMYFVSHSLLDRLHFVFLCSKGELLLAK